jgi:hypothetical protein
MSLAPAEGGMIAAFLAELRRDLPAGSGRRRILAEVGAHLEDGAEAARAAGLPPPDAERRAVERFGPPGELARRLAADLAAEGARSAAAISALALAGMVALWIVMGSVSRTPAWPGAALPEELRWPLLITWAAFAVALGAITLALGLNRARRPRAAVAAALAAVLAIGASTAACLLIVLNGEYLRAEHAAAAIAGVRVAVTLGAALLVARAAVRVAGAPSRRAC